MGENSSVLRIRAHPFKPGLRGVPQPLVVYMAEMYDDEVPIGRQVWACGHEHQSIALATQCGESELKRRLAVAGS